MICVQYPERFFIPIRQKPSSVWTSASKDRRLLSAPCASRWNLVWCSPWVPRRPRCQATDVSYQLMKNWCYILDVQHHCPHTATLKDLLCGYHPSLSLTLDPATRHIPVSILLSITQNQVCKSAKSHSAVSLTALQPSQYVIYHT
mgnify:CR=1 FL=1